MTKNGFHTVEFLHFIAVLYISVTCNLCTCDTYVIYGSVRLLLDCPVNITSVCLFLCVASGRAIFNHIENFLRVQMEA